MVVRIKFNLRGLEEVAKSAPVRAEVGRLADQVASNVRTQGHRVDGAPGDVALPVDVHNNVTDDMRVNRALSRVVLAHAAGRAIQAKHGALTKAAAQTGLKVKPRRK